MPSVWVGSCRSQNSWVGYSGWVGSVGYWVQGLGKEIWTHVHLWSTANDLRHRTYDMRMWLLSCWISFILLFILLLFFFFLVGGGLFQKSLAPTFQIGSGWNMAGNILQVIYTSNDGVEFLIWRYTCKTAAMTSFTQKCCHLVRARWASARCSMHIQPASICVYSSWSTVHSYLFYLQVLYKVKAHVTDCSSLIVWFPSQATRSGLDLNCMGTMSCNTTATAQFCQTVAIRPESITPVSP